MKPGCPTSRWCLIATANIRKMSVFSAGYPRKRVCQFFGGPPVASTQHRSAIRQQIRGQQAPQQAPRAAHSKLSRSRSEVETVAFKQSAVNGLSKASRRTSRRTARHGRPASHGDVAAERQPLGGHDGLSATVIGGSGGGHPC
jgi:hypothetical protein